MAQGDGRRVNCVPILILCVHFELKIGLARIEVTLASFRSYICHLSAILAMPRLINVTGHYCRRGDTETGRVSRPTLAIVGSLVILK